MSWYLANEDGIIDQFASVSGLRALRDACDDQPALHDFFELGATNDIEQCVIGLGWVADTHADPDVKDTAKGLAELMRGQTLVSITQGFETSPKKLSKAAKAKKKAAPKKGQAWFERKVAALKKEAEKLPTARQKELKRALKKGK